MRHLLSELPQLERLVGSRKELLVATDFDGTLCPIALAPSQVTVPSGVCEVLGELSTAAGTTVAILTGRPLADIRALLPLDAVYAGNHGLEIAGGGLRFQHPQAQAVQDFLAELCSGLRIGLDAWDGAWVEDKGLTATVHYRQVCDRDHNKVVMAVRAYMHRFDEIFGVRMGRKAVEIYPLVGWGKGEGLRYIRKELNLAQALCVCIGDDQTDESMFAAFPDEVSIRVSMDGPSRAKYYLRDCSEVLVLLERLMSYKLPPVFAC